MSEKTVSVNVGDLIFEDRMSNGVSVAVGVKPSIQAAVILENTNGEEGLCLGLPGTVTEAVTVLGSITLSEVAKAMRTQSEIISSLSYEFVLDNLHEEAAKGPIEHPALDEVNYE